MIAPEENDGIVVESVSFEFLEDITDLFVHDGDVVVILCEVTAYDGCVRIVRRDLDPGGIMDCFVDAPALAFVRNGEKNGLSFGRSLFRQSPRLASQVVKGGLNW